MMNILLADLKNLRYLEGWLTIIGKAVFCLFIAMICYTLLRRYAGAEWWLELGLPVAVALASFAALLILQTIYLRTGSGYRVGMVSRAGPMPLTEWYECRSRLGAIVVDEQLGSTMALRVLPRHWAKTPKRLKRHAQRYNFLAVIWHDCVNEGGELQHKFTATIFRPSMPEDFVAATMDHASALLRADTSMQSATVIKSIRQPHEKLFELILLWASAQSYCNAEYRNAGAAAEALVTSLLARNASNKKLVKAVQWLEVESKTASARYQNNAIPPAERLIEARDAVNEMLRKYPEEFPVLYHRAARNEFFCGDLDAALLRAEKLCALVSVESEQSALATAHLNCAVLHLFRGNWLNAAKFFGRVSSYPELRQHLEGIVDFADFARDRGHVGAEFIQVLYRRWFGIPVEKSLFHECDAWLKEDASRRPLRDLLMAAQAKNGRKTVSKSRKPKKRKQR